MDKISENVLKAVTPVLNGLGFEVTDVEFTKKYGQDNLTVFIHKDGGITLDDCEKAHNTIDPVLDELNPTQDKPYVLNVSSPGLDRPFKTQRDYERNYGLEVEIKLFAPLMGKKNYEGVLISHDQNVTIFTHKGAETKIENTRIAKVSPLIKFG